MREGSKERKSYFAYAMLLPVEGKRMQCCRIEYQRGVSTNLVPVNTSTVRNVQMLDEGFYKVETNGSEYFVKVLESNNDQIRFAQLIETPVVGEVFSCMELKLKAGELSRDARRTSKVLDIALIGNGFCQVSTKNSRYVCMAM